MKHNWRTIGEIIAIVSVVVSLLFVGYELRLSRDIARSEGLGTAGQFQIDVYDAIAQNGDIWYRGCLGEHLEPEEKLIFANLFAQVETRAFITYRRARTGVTQADPDSFIQSFALSIYRYPGFKNVWEEYTLARTPNLDRNSAGPWYQLINDLVTEFESMGAVKEYDVSYCGRD